MAIFGVTLSPDEAETVRAYIECSKDFRVAIYNKLHTVAYGGNADTDNPLMQSAAVYVLNYVQEQNCLIDDIAKKIMLHQLDARNKDKSEEGRAR